jgi:uncharacterized protein (TIGR03435 family)
MELLAGRLTQYARMGGVMGFGIDRPVIDMTGLKGDYDFLLDYGRVGGRRSDPESTTAEVISLVDALAQVGLKLEPSKRPFDYIVIDHVDRVPTEN